MPLSADDYFPDTEHFPALMDCAIELTRDSAAWFIPAYILANAPLALALIIGLNAISSRDAGVAMMAAALATLAFPWRWIVQTFIQRRLLLILSPKLSIPLWRRMWSIIVLKFMLCAIGISGAFIALIPSFASLAGCTLAAPFLLNEPTVDFAAARRLMAIPYSASRIIIGLIVLGLLYLIFSGITWELLALIAKPILPSFFGVHDLYLQLIVQSRAFGLSVWLLCLVPLDMFWMAAGVILSEQIGFRRTGADLKARLLSMAGDAST
ncbi:MAG: hypothetical protein ACP5O1_00650 [Phycisphaerae bacterium]